MFWLILPLVLLTLVSGGVLAFSFKYLSPINPDGALIVINLVYFFVSAWVFIAGTVSLLLYSAGSFQFRRKRTSEVESIHRPRILLASSLRQGVLIASGLVGVGLLNALRLSNPLNIILLLSALVLVEVYLFSH